MKASACALASSSRRCSPSELVVPARVTPLCSLRPASPSSCLPASTCERQGGNKVGGDPYKFLCALRIEVDAHFTSAVGIPATKLGPTNPAQLQPASTQMWSFASAMYTAQVRPPPREHCVTPHPRLHSGTGHETARSTPTTRQTIQMLSCSTSRRALILNVTILCLRRH